MTHYYAVPREQQDFSPETHIRIVSCGYDYIPSVPMHFSRTRKDYYLTFLSQGQVRYVHDGVCHRLQPGDGFLYFPDERQEVFFDVVSDKTVVYFVHFFGDGIAPLLKTLGLTSGVLHPQDQAEISDLYNKLIHVFKVRRENYQTFALGVFYELISTIASPATSKIEEKMALAIEKIHETPTVSVEQCAALCHYSPAHFTKLFKARYGETPNDYKQTILIERAKELLLTTEKSVSEIAILLGFEYNVLYFWKIFKRRTGKTPKEYRANR